ncbi:hypothetical protein CYMTET_6331 [Cymbomonas tetramitiformis]|uniref:Uncharacterized protein n=1 Tax=Cymbomonas tetramitiformis TaxID=36881 RepID=A0AAE0LI64_9CHLO|nr:hypothetical protein CYMTET_6331 [Cymbomonas tetramitiformis]|eukprot:gene7007-8356_t
MDVVLVEFTEMKPNLRRASDRLMPLSKGTVCLIAQTSEFFISVGEHPEWNGSFIVWGEVEDMKVIDTVTTLPYKDFKHPQYGTVMRMLLSEIRFDMEME